MLGGQFRAIRAKPQTSKFGALTKPTDVATLKKETRARVSDVLGTPKKSLLQDTKTDIKKQANEEAQRVEDLKEAEDAKNRAEASKVTSSESFLTRLSSVLGVKKSALKVKDKETIIADTTTKIETLKQKAVDDAKNEAEVAKDIKIESNKNVLTQKVNDLNDRISTLKNNFFTNINNVFIRATAPNRLRDNASGRVDKIRARDAETKATSMKDSENKNKSIEKSAKDKSDTAKDDTDFTPLERGNQIGDDGTNFKKKSKDAKDDADVEASKNKEKKEKNEKDSSNRANENARDLDNPKRGLDSDDAKVKSNTAKKDATDSKDADGTGKNKSETEAKKTENAKNDAADLGGPRKKFDSEDAKNKSKKADDDAKKSKDADADSKKKDAEQRKKTEEAEAEARRLRDSDDSKKVKEDAEAQRKKDSDQNKKSKNDNDGMSKVRDGLSKLSSLLGLISTGLTIRGLLNPPPPPPEKTFCELNPTHPTCTSVCVGPLCGVYIPPVTPNNNNNNNNNNNAPSNAPNAVKPSPFSFPEFNGILSFLLFTLQNDPENDVSIILEPNDEKIKFVDSKISFPKAEWDKTVKIPFYISVPDLSGNEEFESLPVDEKVNTIKKKKKKEKKENKRVQKDLVSLKEYYPTQKQIDILAIRLKYLLNKSDTELDRALQQIHENIRIKRQIGFYDTRKEKTNIVGNKITVIVPIDDSSDIEPTYDDNKYKNIDRDSVEPTYDDSIYKRIDTDSVEPTYSDSEYREYGEDVEPTYDVRPSNKRVEFEPTMVTQEGGQEEEGEEGDMGEVMASSEALPDEYKAYFTMSIVGDVKVAFDLEVLSESKLYQTDPDLVSFNTETSANEVAIFSSETFNAIQNTFRINDAIEETEEFNEDINNQYLNEYENILEEREYEDAAANGVYDEVYNRSLQDTNARIREAEYLRNQLITGGLRKHFTRKYNHILSAK
jgi:hypothetical protein